MTNLSGIDWNDAFQNADYIPDGMSFPDLWQSRADTFRQSAEKAEYDLAYGAAAREKMDLFWPDGSPRGLVVFVHGGYWLKFDKSYWSHLAGGALARGWAVAIPGYTLAPEVSIADITTQIGRAVTLAAQRVDGPIRLAGHSAGGHLATRMVCKQGPLGPDITHRIAHVVSISGLHDLRPLRDTDMNAQLGLNGVMALSESAALQEPIPDIRVTAWVGGDERPEFLRQSALLSEAWRRAGCDTKLVVDPNKHHFDVIDGLADPDSPLSTELLA